MNNLGQELKKIKEREGLTYNSKCYYSSMNKKGNENVSHTAADLVSFFNLQHGE